MKSIVKARHPVRIAILLIATTARLYTKVAAVVIMVKGRARFPARTVTGQKRRCSRGLVLQAWRL
jgi:hypothetical protein